MKITKKAVAVQTAIATLLFSMVSTAHAALPAGIAAFFTGLTADFNEFMDSYMYPIAFVIIAALIILRWLKKVPRATS